jgi:hypothetical protein
VAFFLVTSPHRLRTDERSLNCWAKSKEPDAASKAEEMLMAMGRLYATGMDSVKPDAFSVRFSTCVTWRPSFIASFSLMNLFRFLSSVYGLHRCLVEKWIQGGSRSRRATS